MQPNLPGCQQSLAQFDATLSHPSERSELLNRLAGIDRPWIDLGRHLCAVRSGDSGHGRTGDAADSDPGVDDGSDGANHGRDSDMGDALSGAGGLDHDDGDDDGDGDGDGGGGGGGGTSGSDDESDRMRA